MSPDEPERSLDEAIEQQLPALRDFVRRRMSDAVAAEHMSVDLVQSVCRELAARDQTFEYRSDAELRSWLFRTAVHKVIEKARQQSRRSTRACDAATRGEGLLDDLTPSRVVMAREDIESLRKALEQMPALDREIIELTRLGGASHAEVAARLGISEQVSRTRLRRALIKLAELLEKNS